RCARRTWSVRDSPEDSREPGYVYPSPAPKGQRVEQVVEHARVGAELVEACRGAVGDVVCERPGGLRAEPLRVAVAVEEVVDHLEKEPDVFAEGDPGRMLVLGHTGDVEADADGRDEEPARLQPVQLGE